MTWILSHPGGAQGATDDRLVESVDLFPTLCELAGLPIPAGGDGRSLLDSGTAPHSHTVCEWDFYDEYQSRVLAIRDARYRLVYYSSDPEDGELYDHRSDPGEMVNLYNKEALPALPFNTALP